MCADVLIGLNLGAHQQAAEHFLSTLVMQDSDGRGTKSDQVWLTLRKTFAAMVRVLLPT